MARSRDVDDVSNEGVDGDRSLLCDLAKASNYIIAFVRRLRTTIVDPGV